MAYITNTKKNITGTSLYISDAMQQGILYEGVNNITQTNNNLPFEISLDYYSQENPYQDVIYSQDDRNDIKIWFDNVELENASTYCEKLTRIARVLPDDGNKRFSLDNFISTNVEVILHNVNVEDIKDRVKIDIGTLVGNDYQYIPLGIFNIQDTPEKDGTTITLKLRDNRVKFDFNYDAQPLIERQGGMATKLEILYDICDIAGVETEISSFYGDTDEVGIYDNTISGTTYVSYLMEQAGCIAAIDRYGKLIKIDLRDLYIWRIPLSVVESYQLGKPYKVERVVYESGIIKYETSDDKTLDTLYLNADNPYINSQEQVENILNIIENFQIDSVETKRVLGNPAIDPYDIIEVYNDIDGTNDIVFRTLANTTYTFNGVHRDTFDTQIGIEQRTENVTLTGEVAFKKYAKTSIDNLTAEINLISSETMIFSKEKFGLGELTLENAYVGTLHRLEINGNINKLLPMNTLYPKNNLIPLDTYLLVDGTRYLLDIDYLSYTSEEEHDSFIYEEGKCWIERANGTIEEKSDLIIYVNSNSVISIEHYSNAILKCIYLLDNEYTSTFTNTMDIMSQINLSPGTAKILANKIKLEGYTTINENFGVDLEGNMWAKNGSFSGNIYLEDGNKILGGDGLYSCLSYTSTGRYSGWEILGFSTSGYNLTSTETRYSDVFVNAYIPEKFVVESAYIILECSSMYSAYEDASGGHDVVGIPKNLKLFKGSNLTTVSFFYYPYQAVDEYTEYSGDEIQNAFESNSYTPDISYPGNVNVKRTIDISEYIDNGFNSFFVRSMLSPKPVVKTFRPAGATFDYYNYEEIVNNTGIGRLSLYVYGFMNVSEEV